MDHSVVFQDQTGRRRRLQLHSVDDQLRVNLGVALANYDAVSFTRQSDGLVIEPHGDSQWSHIGFITGEEVHVESVRRAPGTDRMGFEAVSALCAPGVLARRESHAALTLSQVDTQRAFQPVAAMSRLDSRSHPQQCAH